SGGGGLGEGGGGGGRRHCVVHRDCRRSAMKIWQRLSVTGVLVVLAGVLANQATSRSSDDDGDREPVASFDRRIDSNSRQMVREGRKIFRFDTFGDEAFWGDLLGLH